MFEKPGPPGALAAGGGVTSPGESPGGQHLSACNTTGFELSGPFEHVLVGVEGFHALDLCDVAVFDADRIPDWEPVHGSFPDSIYQYTC